MLFIYFCCLQGAGFEPDILLKGQTRDVNGRTPAYTGDRDTCIWWDESRYDIER